MSTTRNGQHPGHRNPIRRLRFDNLAPIVTGDTAGPNPGSATATAEVLPLGHSGRRFVLVAGITVLLIWGALYLIFREWRANYRERAAYGLTQVVPAIDPLAEIAPPSLDPIAWRDGVHQTHAMLVTVISSNLLDVAAMRRLRDELDQAVARARAHPETALDELAAIWNVQADRAEFLFKDSRSASGDRHPRPKILPPRPKKAPRSSS
jgi:hypothetical protein